VALGILIGLMIGLAQVILKDAWLKVEEGFRAGRELILSRPEITIGRAEGCDIGLFGDQRVEKLHARIVQKDGRYVIEDTGTPHGTFVNNQRINGPTPLNTGDLIRVGRNILRFAEHARRT
jgi:pSer/pThr/pTyr-binding forkhead associated (FHA) protein